QAGGLAGGVALLHQVHQHLGVGLREEDMPGGAEALAQLHVVLDDAVMDNGQAPVLREVGVGVRVVGPAVRGQRVWPRPRPPITRVPAMASFSTDSLPARLTICKECGAMFGT